MLSVVATPIGNLGDLSPRAEAALRGASLIACEDTRRTWQLLSHFGVPRPEMISYRQGNEERVTRTVIDAVKAGREVVLASDGYPKKYASGFEMTLPALGADEHLFVAGAKLEGGKLLTAGGRVIGAVATADTLEAAIKHAYEVAEKVQFENKYCRKDIGARALAAK